jgi:hypothetical protein
MTMTIDVQNPIDRLRDKAGVGRDASSAAIAPRPFARTSYAGPGLRCTVGEEELLHEVTEGVNSGGATILRHPAAPAQPTRPERYLDPTVDMGQLKIPLVRFPGKMQVLPDLEKVYFGVTAFAQEVAPDPTPIIEDKDRVPYYIAGTLRDAELINAKLRDARIAEGLNTVGKQRSGTSPPSGQLYS